MEKFSFEEKLEAVRRELGYRRRVYPRRIELNQMTQKLADRQIAIFEDLEKDLEQAAQSGRLF